MVRPGIVVPTYENAATLAPVLEAAVPQAPVWVVDDASADGTRDLALASGARLITVSARSAAHARNEGWRAAKAAGCDVVLFLDADAVPAHDWADALAARLSRGDCDIAGGDVRSRPTTATGRAVERMYRALDASHFHDGSVLLPAMNLGVRADLALRFDDALPGAMCEDVDLLVRAKKAGLRIAFEPAALVHHRHPESVRAYVRQEVRHGRGRARLIAKHPERAGDARIATWPAWLVDATLKAPWHLEHARRRVGFDPAVMLLHWLRMAAGNWGCVSERRKLGL